jgi:hypothetical protein
MVFGTAVPFFGADRVGGGEQVAGTAGLVDLGPVAKDAANATDAHGEMRVGHHAGGLAVHLDRQPMEVVLVDEWHDPLLPRVRRTVDVDPSG